MANDGGVVAANLLDTFRDALNTDFVAQVANRLGEPEPQLRAAVNGMVPVLLGTMLQRGSPDNVGVLVKSAASVPADPLVLERPASLLTEDTGALERLTTMGPGLLGFLFGNRAAAVAPALASASGIRSSSATWLGAVLAPLTCALLNREVRRGGLDDHGVVQLLDAQREPLRAALDRELVTAIGIGALTRMLPEQSAGTAAADNDDDITATHSSDSAAPSAAGAQPVALWVVLGLIVLAVLGYFIAR